MKARRVPIERLLELLAQEGAILQRNNLEKRVTLRYGETRQSIRRKHFDRLKAQGMITYLTTSKNGGVSTYALAHVEITNVI